MFKLFTLAAATAFLPLSQLPHIRLTAERTAVRPLHINNTVKDPFTTKKEAPETWSQGWLAMAQEGIRKSEYNFTWEEKWKAYCTPNRKKGLRFFYDEKGFTAEPRITTAAVDINSTIAQVDDKPAAYWKVRFALDETQVGSGSWHICDNRAEYRANKMTVQYINNEEGMRQNFIVNAPLAAGNELKINFSIHTKLKTWLHGNQLQFFHKKAGNVLNYEQLKVWDATGRLLDASIRKSRGNRYSICVNTEHAVYPVMIDPLSTTPATGLGDANQAQAVFGISVSSAGDVNGDGYSDVIIGASALTVGANTWEGAAFVYHGSAGGLSAVPNSIHHDAGQAFANYGYSVSTAGDVNGDGYSDVIIGAFAYDEGINNNEGRAYIYHGSPAGLSAIPNMTLDDADQNNCNFGLSVGCAGDVNGDGYSDVIIGCDQYQETFVGFEGRAYVHYGSPGGIPFAPDITIDDAGQRGARLGNCVAGAGDINGDGYSDVIVGAWLYDDGASADEGAAFIYYGSATGLAASPVIIANADQAGAQFGISASAIGDVNGDGYSDVAIGAHKYDDGSSTDEGRVFIYYGSAAGLPATPGGILGDANQANAYFGWSVACAGDINADGCSDVVVGAYAYDDGANTDEGRVFIYYGSSTGLGAAPGTVLDAANQASASFGSRVTSAGDVNGDGYSDVIVGANRYDDGGNTDEGRAFVFHGSAAGLSLVPNSTCDDADQLGGHAGGAVASAGDINADGYGDVIIGAQDFDNGANVNEGRVFIYHGSAGGLSLTPNSSPAHAGQAGARYGNSVAPAGDVNGDGYGDVIVGCFDYTDGANVFEGRAFVYHGSPTGIIATPAATPDDADQGSAFFGISVACAGDLNGDGYSDVIIGAYGYDEGINIDEGQAYIYYGSATGLQNSPGEILDDADQANAQFGNSVAGAGDVNGDSYSDVIVGTALYDDGANVDEGRALVYYGGSLGVSAVPDKILDDADQPNASFGSSVASAGDINADGYSDVVVGAHLYDNGANVDEGRAFVYYGSATGLPAVPNSTPGDAGQAGAFFGKSVAGAGDVNGDGYSDLVIGAFGYDDGANIDEGRVFIYHGSATGLSALAVNTPDDADQATAFLGYSVAAAGDVNGDGYSDVIIGSPLYDETHVDEGVSFIYNGNELTANMRNNLRLYNSDLVTPLNSSNFVFANFGAGLFARSYIGRGKGKMVWETRISYTPYSGTPVTNSTLYTAQQAVFTDLGLAGTELKNVIGKLGGAGIYTKLRARVKYDPVTAITGQVYGPWRNVSSIIDGNKQGVLPVELISFEAAWLQKGRTARIDFTTDKENGICCFDIEKSLNGFDYNSITTIPARNSSGIQSYSYTDHAAVNRKQYYRLKIKGTNGQVEYSTIRQLQNTTATEILLFPNPVTEVLQLQLNNDNKSIQVQIASSTGQWVKRYDGLTINDRVVKIPVSGLPSGCYWLHLQSAGEKQVLQFIKK